MIYEWTWIYGVFIGSRCIYVGRTQCPDGRREVHERNFGKLLGVKPRFKTFKVVKERNAAIKEREMIRFYKAKGEADYNISGVEREKIGPPIYVSRELHAKLKARAASEGKKLGAFCAEILWALVNEQHQEAA